jgi:hypothetical protein
MDTNEGLRRIVVALTEAEIPFMLAGSFASAYHGRPRATQDIDVIIAATLDKLRILCRVLASADFYVEEYSALQALRQQDMFNVLDNVTGWKTDLIILKRTAYSQEAFHRRIPVTMGSVALFVARAEDTILSKLEWAHMGSSLRQIEDVVGILKTQGGAVDRAYIEKWVRELGLSSEWYQARQRAGVFEE